MYQNKNGFLRYLSHAEVPYSPSATFSHCFHSPLSISTKSTRPYSTRIVHKIIMGNGTGLWALTETVCLFYLTLYYLKCDPKCFTGSQSDLLVSSLFLAIIAGIIDRIACKLCRLWVRS